MRTEANSKIKLFWRGVAAMYLKRMKNDDGSAIVVALMVMILLMGFAALAITRTTSETFSASNDRTESVTFDAANGCLEIMTRNFDKIFDNKLNPNAADLLRVKGQTPPGFPNFTFTQDVIQTGPAKTVVMNGTMYQGLSALQDRWLLNCLVTHNATDVKVNVQRYFLNNRIPIFQFGIFYDDDMEFHPGPRFDFGGRVHSNSSIFFAAGTGLFFSSKVTAHKQVFTNVGKNGFPYTTWGDNVNIRNAAGVYVRLANNMGSVLTTPVNGTPKTVAPEPTAYVNANWPASQGLFQGNLLAEQSMLTLPIKLNAVNLGRTVDLVELVKRGKDVGDLWNADSQTVPRPNGPPNILPVVAATSDDAVTASDRYYNKTGIRINFADSKAKLPGCADAAGNPIAGRCGIRLDGAAAPGAAGAGPGGGPRGYQPLQMSDGYLGTELNGERFFRNFNQEDGAPVQTWVKIETVVFNAATQVYDKVDITEDILALGITEPSGYVNDPRYPANTDSRSVVKLQRYNIPGAVIPKQTAAIAPNSYLTSNGTDNLVVAGRVSANPSTRTCDHGTYAVRDGGDSVANNNFTQDNQAHARRTTTAALGVGIPNTPGSLYGCIVPVPINMFDTREGLFNETLGVFNRDTVYANAALAPAGKNVPWTGIMSLVDIDVANLKRFMDGTYDVAPRLPAAGTAFTAINGRALRSTDIPSSNGWVLYVSDRRGDYDFDGEYDMEDIFGNNNGGNPDPGEDVNADGRLQSDTAEESRSYVTAIPPDVAAVFDHKYYRRGVRLINGTDLPGNYNIATPANSLGFTVASENGVYVFGNYNATGVANAAGFSVVADYLPQGARDVPASIAADAVTILSRSWSDANSFANPYDSADRIAALETTTRFAMLSGDTITTLNGTPNQGGTDTRMNGGVHNFIRFLEQWNVRLNYCGSLINLFNSHNNNGAYKNGQATVYAPPTRNWIFDSTFLDINRIPPGTPFFQSIQITGFQRMN